MYRERGERRVMRGARHTSRVTLNALRQQLRLKALCLGDALDLDRDGVDGLLEMEEPVIVGGRPSREPFGSHEEQARRDADTHEAPDRGDDRRADGGESDYVWIHGREWRVTRGEWRAIRSEAFSLAPST